MRRRFRLGLALLAGLVLVAGALTLTGDHTDARVAPAADVTQFNPGNIISDSVFFNAAAMSTGDVDAFIQAKGLGCRAGSDGTPCLKDFTQDTSSRAGDTYCSGYTGGADESAAVIITKVASACGINPQVLMVIMQKEQGLLTDSGSSLYASRYRIAMGYGCPDTAACDTTYYGFQNQVYSAARQYRRYAANPDSFGYHVGRTSNILWNPNSACGSSPVYVQNQATAGLYNYTPYQPNAAALAAGYGTGDSCSAYGNRNFWLYFTDWFGSTQSAGQSAWDPVGTLDEPVVTGPIVAVTGWAADPDVLSTSLTVHVYVDGVGVDILTADQPRAGLTGYHAYAAQVPMTVGGHTVCTYALNVGRGSNNTNLGCQTVTVTAQNGDNPIGVESVAGSGRSVTVWGWALDPNAPSSAIAVHVYADGVGAAILQADQTGVPTDTYVPGAGGAHGYSATLKLAAGRHNVCMYGINVGAGTANTVLGCTSVYLNPASYNPVGSWDATTLDGNVLHVSGWARDDDSTGPIQVPVYVNGVGVAILTAGGPNPTADGYGFDAQIRLPALSDQVCVYAVNVGDGTTNPVLGCRTTTIAATVFNPQGALQSVQAVGGAVTVSGWATDADTPTSPVTVHVYSDGVPQLATLANGANPAADGHGYSATVSLAAGTHNVCTYGINVGLGTTNPLLGCRSVTVQTNPVGALSDVSVEGGTATLTGWAVDPDVPSSALTVHVYLDGVPQFAITAGGADPAADGHGYTATLSNLAQGNHTICTYGINVGPGNANTQLGCKTVTVSHNPSGELQSATAVGGTASIAGWAVDPDAPAQALTVHVYLDGVVQFAVAANGPDATANGHGYTATLSNLAQGAHTICTYGINVGAGNANTLLGCETVTVSHSPGGAVENVTVSSRTVTISGWTVDPDASGQALTVHIYLDGAPQFPVIANGPDPVANGHGFTATLTLPPGEHTVGAWALNVGSGTSNTLLGNRTVAIG